MRHFFFVMLLPVILFARQPSGEVLPVKNPDKTSFLENLSEGDRQNSLIQFDLLPSDGALFEKAKYVEKLWNNGEYEEAIREIKSGELFRIPFGISWKNPIKTSVPLWGDDIQLDTLTSVTCLDLDFDIHTGNTFAITLHKDNDNLYRWSVYFSTDTGKTWTKTYTWNSENIMNEISGTPLGNYYYISYLSTSNTYVMVRRVFAATGQIDVNYIYTIVSTEPDSVREVELTSNMYTYDNRIYCAFIDGNDTLKVFWTDTSAASWTEGSPSVFNAMQGLDIDYTPSSTYFLYVSYITTDSLLKVVGWNYPNWDELFSLSSVGFGSWWKSTTSIGAYRDTVMVAYTTSYSPNRLNYYISRDAGTTWDQGSLTDTLTTTHDITLDGRNGSGVVAVERRGLSFVGTFRWRDLQPGTWSDPDTFTDHEPRIIVKPAITYMAENRYGILYADWPSQIAYFDRSDFTGIEEEMDKPAHVFTILSKTPAIISGDLSLKLNISHGTELTMYIYDPMGRMVKTAFKGFVPAGIHTLTWDGTDASGRHVKNGVYFFLITASGEKKTGRILIIK